MDFSIFLLKKHKEVTLLNCVCKVLNLDRVNIVDGFENHSNQSLVYSIYYKVEESQFKTQLDIWVKDDLIQDAKDFVFEMNRLLCDKIVIPYDEEYSILIDECLNEYLVREKEGVVGIDFNEQFWADIDNKIPIEKGKSGTPPQD